MNEFDICIIGGGPGGYTAALEAEKKGLKILLVENEKLGGTCLNLGCIPTKSLLKSAESYNEVLKNQNRIFDFTNFDINYPEIINSSKKNIKRLLSGLEHLIKNKKITYLEGFASFIDINTVQVKKKDEVVNFKSKNFIISTGAIPSYPKNLAPDNNKIFDSDGILNLKYLPKKILIVGGGYIGIEFAYFFNSLGSEVSIIESQSSILGSLDSDIVKELKNNFLKRGIKIYENSKFQIDKLNKDNIEVLINKEKDLYEIILLATGRKPRTDKLNLDSINLAISETGHINIDGEYKSNLNNIYAIGDVIKGPMLAHRASFDASKVIEIISENKLDHKSIVPSCIYCQPEIASIGLTEDYLIENNIDFKKGLSPFKINGKSLAQGENRGFCKILVDKEMKILGAHIIGKGATEMITELNIIMTNNLSIKAITNTMHPHPTLSEIIYECCLEIISKVKNT